MVIKPFLFSFKGFRQIYFEKEKGLLLPENYYPMAPLKQKLYLLNMMKPIRRPSRSIHDCFLWKYHLRFSTDCRDHSIAIPLHWILSSQTPFTRHRKTCRTITMHDDFFKL